MNFFIGTHIDNEEMIPTSIRDKMEEVEVNQYFIPSFIEYQYGQLRINSKPHLSVIKRLEEINRFKIFK